MKNDTSEFINKCLPSIEHIIWDYQAENPNSLISFSDESFRSALKIFITAMSEKIFERENKLDMTFDEKIKEAENFGDDARKLVLKYTFIDTRKLY